MIKSEDIQRCIMCDHWFNIHQSYGLCSGYSPHGMRYDVDPILSFFYKYLHFIQKNENNIEWTWYYEDIQVSAFFYMFTYQIGKFHFNGSSKL